MHVRKMLPRTKHRSEPPAWEVKADDGTLLGWIEEHALRGASRPFYLATGVHPVTGREVRLELSTDFEERCDVLVRFHSDPSEFRQHLGWQG